MSPAPFNTAGAVGKWRRGMMLAGLVVLTAALSVGSMAVLRQMQVKRQINPDRYAQRSASQLADKLDLDARRRAEIQSILSDHKEQLNAKAHDLIAAWEALFAHMADQPEEALRADFEEIHRLERERNALRLKTLLLLGAEMSPDQRKAYAEWMVQMAQEMDRRLRKAE